MFKKAFAATSALVIGSSAHAADWTAVTTGMDFSGEIAGITAVVGVLAGVYVVRRGARLLLSVIK